MRRIAFLLVPILALFSPAARAGEWRALSGDEIAQALTGRKLVYANCAWQDFRASGKTLYNSGRDSWGNWGVRGDQYCSQWPPSDGWACYGVRSDGSSVRFVDGVGEVSEGAYVD